MIRTLAKILKIIFYSAVIIIGADFSVNNRAPVNLQLYPFGSELSLPLYLFTILVFAIGALTGWMITGVKTIRQGHARRQAEKRVSKLENEIGSLRAEGMIKSAAALPQK